MIILRDVCKFYKTRHGSRKVLNGINISIARGERIGILGRNGAGKSTLIRLISGAESVTSGAILREMSVSWPLAFGGAFQGSLTGMDNLRFICRVYGADYARAAPFVSEFSELGDYLNEPVNVYSSGMRAKLAFGISLAIDFDCFLIDEVTAVGDSRFAKKCHYELFEKRKDKAFIIVSHHVATITEHCQQAAVLHEGDLIKFPTVDSAYSFYSAAD